MLAESVQNHVSILTAAHRCMYILKRLKIGLTMNSSQKSNTIRYEDAIYIFCVKFDPSSMVSSYCINYATFIFRTFNDIGQLLDYET